MIPVELHQQINIAAAIEDIQLQQWVCRALTEAVEKSKKPQTEGK